MTNVYSTCKDATVRVVPKVRTSYVYASSEPYDEFTRFSRCNDSFVSTSATPPEVQIPKDYSIHATRGASLTINYFSSLAWSLSQISGTEDNKLEGTIPLNSIWALTEISDLEGSEGILNWKSLVYDGIIFKINTASSAFLATYLIGLFYSAIMFFWLVRPMLNDFTVEIRHNRASKIIIIKD